MIDRRPRRRPADDRPHRDPRLRRRPRRTRRPPPRRRCAASSSPPSRPPSTPQGATHPLLAGAGVDLIEAVDGYRFLVQPNRGAREFAPQLIVDIGNAGSSTGGRPTRVHRQRDQRERAGLRRRGRVTAASQTDATAGADGDLPDATALEGAPGEPPTGMYALTKVDLFNLLCIPRAADLPDAQADALIGDALTFCEEERALLLIDIPADRNTVQEIKDWIDDNASYRHKNSALYFPRVRVADPLDEFRLRSIGSRRDGGRHLRSYRRHPRRVEGPRRPRGQAARRLGARPEAHRSRERLAQPDRGERAAGVPDPRPGGLGRRARSTARTRSPRSGSTSTSAAPL